MPCDTVVPPKTIEQALERLEKSLGTGKVTLKIGQQGAIAIVGWADRDGVSDVCALRKMALMNSWEFRKALAKAEAQAGRKANMQAVADGVHSHDGGHTWGKE